MSYVEEDKLKYHVYVKCSDIWLDKNEWEATSVFFKNAYPWSTSVLSEYDKSILNLAIQQSAEKFTKDFPQYDI